MNQIDFKHFQNFWIKQQENAVHMNKEDALRYIEDYIERHNTCAMATGYGDYIRNTPIEYTYLDGKFCFFSEGGNKFIGLEKNRNVSLVICDPYIDQNHSHGLQVNGTAEFYDMESEEFKAVLSYKNIPYEMVKEAGVEILLIKVCPSIYEMYDTDFIEMGYDIRQTVNLK